MISVGIKELKEKLSRYVERVRRGEEIVVTDRGKEVARVIPISQERETVISTREAGRLVRAYGLRGLDAVHLSSALLLKAYESRISIAFSSFDNRLNSAAASERLDVLLP